MGRSQRRDLSWDHTPCYARLLQWPGIFLLDSHYFKSLARLSFWQWWLHWRVQSRHCHFFSCHCKHYNCQGCQGIFAPAMTAPVILCLLQESWPCQGYSRWHHLKCFMCLCLLCSHFRCPHLDPKETSVPPITVRPCGSSMPLQTGKMVQKV
jgi:hypothetical protein